MLGFDDRGRNFAAPVVYVSTSEKEISYHFGPIFKNFYERLLPLW